MSDPKARYQYSGPILAYFTRVMPEVEKVIGRDFYAESHPPDHAVTTIWTNDAAGLAELQRRYPLHG